MPNNIPQSGHNRKAPLPAPAAEPTPRTVTLESLAKDAQKLGDKRTAMLKAAVGMNVAIARVREAHLPAIRVAARVVKRRTEALLSDVTAAPGLFVSPKSRELFGTKMGYRQQSGKLVFPVDGDEDMVEHVRQVAQHHKRPDLLNLIVVKETVSRQLADALSDEDQALLAITTVPGANEPFVRASDVDSDRLVEMALSTEESRS